MLDLRMSDFRDPNVFWHEETANWVMTVTIPKERKVAFFASPDLKHWRPLSEFGPAGSTVGIWECPDLFPLDGKWVLLQNVGGGAPAGGSGCQYFVGDFDGRSFTLDKATHPDDTPLWTDFGRDFYAGVTWSDVPKSDGRRIWIGWMSNWNYANAVPTSPWRSAMSVPRELALTNTDSGFRLTQIPVRELEKIRIRTETFTGGDAAAANAWLTNHTGNLFDVRFEFEGDLTVTLSAGSAETLISHTGDSLSLDRRNSGEIGFHKNFPGIHKAPLPVGGEGTSEMRLIIDTSSVEVFAAGGQAVITDLILPPPGEQFELSVSDAVKAIHLSPLRSIWNQ